LLLNASQQREGRVLLLFRDHGCNLDFVVSGVKYSLLDLSRSQSGAKS
jgi:hypothetical protein